MKNEKKSSCLVTGLKWSAALLAVLLLVIYFFPGKLLDGALSVAGKAADIEVGSKTNISIPSFNFDMKDFYVKNPEGFSEKNAISFKHVRFKLPLEYNTFKAADPIYIEEIRIISPALHAEVKGMFESTNFGVLSDKIKKLIGEKPEDQKTDAEKLQDEIDEKKKELEEKNKPPRRYIVRKVIFEDGTVSLNNGTLPLPSFTLEDLGLEKGGATSSQMVWEIIVQLLQKGLAAITGSDEE